MWGRLSTRYSPVRHSDLISFDESHSVKSSFDLHVLSTPPAFILSQDQTLIKSLIPSELLWLLKRSSFVLRCLPCFKVMFVSEIFLDSSSRNHFKNPLEFSGLFYCSVIKELVRRCVSDLISISCLFCCVKNFFKTFWKFLYQHSNTTFRVSSYWFKVFIFFLSMSSRKDVLYTNIFPRLCQ